MPCDDLYIPFIFFWNPFTHQHPFDRDELCDRSRPSSEARMRTDRNERSFFCPTEAGGIPGILVVAGKSKNRWRFQWENMGTSPINGGGFV